jgi:hypothetical protein
MSMNQPCDKCPEGEGVVIPTPATPAIGPFATNYVIYTGGPFTHLYRMVEAAIPPDADLKHGRPTFHEDGSLEYPPGEAGVEDIHGYQRDAKNPRRFHPVWPECLHRPLCVSVCERLLVIAGKCHHPGTGRLGRTVTIDVCQECPLRRAPRPVGPLPVARTAAKTTGRTGETTSPPCPPEKSTA